MPQHHRRLRAAVLTVATGLTLAGLSVTGTGASAAPAAGGEPVSTPVPISTPDGVVSAYILNAKHANPGQTRLLERAVAKAGGVVVQTWPQIGVVVAHSDRAAFRTDVQAYAGNALESVGATRTVPVTEGTPAGVQAPWGPGKGQVRKDQTSPQQDDTENTVTAADPRETEQWDMQVIKADQAHAITDGSRDVVVGVLDSGIDPDHPDLVANIDVADSVNCSNAGRPDTSPTGWYPTTSDHGTHVAGTIGAARNGTGIVGVAPNVRMASVKVVNDDGFIYPEYAVCGFVWAGMHGMDVTNNSYYVDPFEFYCEDQPDQYAAKEAVRRAVAWSTDQGVVHAAAAGNSGHDLADKSSFLDEGSPDDGTPVTRTLNSGCQDIPTELPGVVTVSASHRNDILAYFSNRGLGVIDVAAPGRSILSTIVNGNGYGLKSGTSMASPHVAGVLALMKSAHPDLTPAQMVAKLRADADDHPCTVQETPPGGGDFGAPCVGTDADNSYYGEGMVDALDAVS
ncbi:MULTISPECIES: S8 family serine peptidase [unclassified Nocardioides]|uniref:S8 family peptidase n=1 Tax=unclassified Nocardioides TaxID=2615069 RepID=UPI001150694F|nr:MULTISPECIES: S8 family serine peptidase [unclassified Nocardioides]TQK69132.1 subtilase family protein [Nocardioides sp. SLBN-35]WGY01561.1 S8 family serine peptidase [Nocardioides sp. QY071]